MSSVRVDISPAKPTRKRDISSWIEPDITRLSTRGEKRYNKRKNAIEDYFTTDLTIEEITLRHHLSSEILMKLVKQSLMQHEDGTLWGYRVLVPGAIVIDHTPLPVSKEDTLPQEQLETPTKADSEEVVDAASCKSDRSTLDVDNDTFIEDDEDTAKRQAVKISPAVVPHATIASASLNGDDKHRVGIDVGKNTEVANGLEEVTELEVGETAENDTELVIVAAEEEQEVGVKGDSELEEAVAQQDTSANEHEEEVEDLSELPNLGPVESTVEEETLEDIDANEEKLDASNNDIAITEFSDAPQPGASRTQVVVRENLIPAVLPLYGKGRKRVNVLKIAEKRRSIRKRWVRDVQDRRKRRRFRSIVATTVVASLMFVIFLPLGTGLAAYSTYNSIRSVALDGVNHLLTVKNLLPISKSDPTAALDAQKLQQAQNEFSMAESDFVGGETACARATLPPSGLTAMMPGTWLRNAEMIAEPLAASSM